MDATAFSHYITQPHVALIDVRTLEEYAEAHLPHATLCDIKSPDFADHIATLLPERSQPIALYCRSGVRSQAAMDYLCFEGYTQVEHLDGGILAWGGATVTE